MISDGTYALAAGTLGGWIQNHWGFLSLQRWFSGGVYITLGLATAFAGSGRSK